MRKRSMEHNVSRQTTRPCAACGRGQYRKATTPRCGPLLRLAARLLGVVAFSGALCGILVALSGFSDHYGAYPEDVLLGRSLLVGCGMLALSIGVGVGCLFLLEQRAVVCCDRCGHRTERC